jgi:hypothetical protein
MSTKRSDLRANFSQSMEADLRKKLGERESRLGVSTFVEVGDLVASDMSKDCYEVHTHGFKKAI